MKYTIPTILLTGILGLGLIGCGKQETEEAAAAETNPQIKAIMLDAEPSGAVSVVQARKNAEPGSEVTVVGRIAGAKQPFTDGYATLVLADKTLVTCEMNPDDACKTPWDACCETPEKIKASRLSIQVTGGDGNPVDQSLEGAGGLDELDEIVVTGKIAEGSTAENLIIDATGIFRKNS